MRYFLVLLIIASTPIIRAQTPATRRTEIRTFVQMFEHFHYSRESVTDKDGKKLILALLEKLDPEHAYFLQRDVDHFLAQFGDRIYVDLQFLGNPVIAEIAMTRLKEKVAERTAWIEKHLKEISSTGGIFQPLASVPSWAAEPKSLDARWQKMLLNEWLLAVAQGTSETAANDHLAQKYRSFSNYLMMRTSDDVVDLLLNSFASLYDNHSTYFRPQALSSSTAEPSDSRVGIGAMIEFTGRQCIITNVLPGGPAANAGIQSHDRLVGVKNSDGSVLHAWGKNPESIAAWLRGPEGSRVTLLVERSHLLRSEALTVTRGHAPTLRITGALYRSAPNANDHRLSFGVLTLPSFYGASSEASQDSATDDVRSFLLWSEKQHTDGLIIDLRNNEGGLLLEVARTGALFLGERLIVREKRFDGEIKEEAVPAPASVYTKPIVVLVNDVTASGAELLTGALQNYNRAVIVGSDRTFGAAFVQAVLELKNFMPRTPASTTTGMTKLTVSEFFLPNGASPQPNGISPDILLSSVSFRTKRPMLETLTASAAILPKLSVLDPTWAANLATLRARSEQRKAELPELQLLQRWSTAQKHGPAAPSGDLAQVRQWLERRRNDKAAFEKEVMALRPQTRFTHAGQYATENKAASETVPMGPDQVYDMELQEALRVLSDFIELEAR